MYFVTETEALVMEQLGEHRQACGADLVAGSNGRLRVGSVYQLLSRLEDKAVVFAWDEPPTRDFIKPKRMYKLTETGEIILYATRAAKAAYAAALEHGRNLSNER